MSSLNLQKMKIRNIRFYDDSLANILDVQNQPLIDCRQVIPGQLIKPTFSIKKIRNSFNFIPPESWVKKEGETNYNEWLDPKYKTNYELYKEWILINGGWGEDEDLNSFFHLLENKFYNNNPFNPQGIYSKSYTIGKGNHPGRRSFQSFYTGLTIPEMIDIINWSNYLISQKSEGIILFDFDGVINLGNGILLWDIFEDDFNRSEQKFNRKITFEGFVKFFIGTKERFETLKEMFRILLKNNTYFFILTFMGRCQYSNIYKRFLQVLNPKFEYCQAFSSLTRGIQTGNIMCCTEDKHLEATRRLYGLNRNKTPSKLQFLYYFLGDNLTNWFNNSLFKPTLLEGGKKSKNFKNKKILKIKK